MVYLLILLIAVGVIFFSNQSLRREKFSRPIFTLFKKILPPMSSTEKEAMESGDVWWDGELFSGKPNWQKLHQMPKPTLNTEEQQFLDNEVNTLISMLDDFKINHEDKDLPADVWEYMKAHGFFAMIIPKRYGGKEFSAIANSTIVSTISSRSLTAAVTVMVPNSLGPGELLLKYGTEDQKDYWLPKLAHGDDVPCFALTGPEAGSDAGGIPDRGTVCYGEHEGKKVLGISLNWNKRYITLAPVATVLGLAFKLDDPEGLLGDQKEIGITCALIPTSHPGVQQSQRHLPMNLAFMNGTTEGKDVFIPLDWIIGGQTYAGKGWRMLVECLSAGRGISLPALSTASGHLATRMTGAYAYVRKQFGLSIGRFEGVQEAMARIGGLTYTLEAMRLMTAGAIDQKVSPGVVTAIAKYHMTEMGRQVINDAMDIHAGKGIQMGPKNYLAQSYTGIPISITVEGANILTRNLMIFGQGATRCHPYVLAEMEAAANPDVEQGLQAFDSLLMKHIKFAMSNTVMTLVHGVTGARLSRAPVSGKTARYYRQLTRMSRALALCADISMLILGGDLKRKEMISARLGDVLSQLYIASTIFKRYEDDGRQVEDLPFVEYGLQRCLYEIGQAFTGFFNNFPNPIIGRILKLLVFPLGNHYQQPQDKLLQKLCQAMLVPSQLRDRLTHLCYIGKGETDATGLMERAFIAMYEAEPIFNKVIKAQRNNKLAKGLTNQELILAATTEGIISEFEQEKLLHAEKLRWASINVDTFTNDELMSGQIKPENTVAA